jgi:hypothetical protein
MTCSLRRRPTGNERHRQPAERAVDGAQHGARESGPEGGEGRHDHGRRGLPFEPDPRIQPGPGCFDIKVSDAITQVQGTNFTYQAACYASGGTSPLCATQTRALGNFTNTPANVVTQWFTFPINFAKVHTWGADFEANYATSIQTHPLTLRGLVTWQPHIKYEMPGLPTQDMGGVAYGANGLQASPVWRATLFARYSPLKDLNVDLMARWRSALGSVPTRPRSRPGGVKSFATTNLNIDYKIKLASGALNLYFNVQNLFNKIPPGANFSGTQQNPGMFGGFAIGDDPVGRYFAAGLRYHLLINFREECHETTVHLSVVLLLLSLSASRRNRRAGHPETRGPMDASAAQGRRGLSRASLYRRYRLHPHQRHGEHQGGGPRFHEGRQGEVSVVERSELKVQDYGDTAIVTFRALIKVNAVTLPSRIIHVFVRQNGEWRMAAYQSTRLPGLSEEPR